MPFTPAHAAAAVAVRALGQRAPALQPLATLPLTALVIGTMSPDLAVIGFQQGLYLFTHSLWGVLLFDAPLTMAITWLWFAYIRDVLADLSPAYVYRRLSPEGSEIAPMIRTYLAGALGAATHVAWDSFTHGGRRGVEWVWLLDATYLGTPGYRWAQYLSGLIGLAIVSVAAWRYLQRCPVVREIAPPKALARWALLTPPAAAVIFASARWASTVESGYYSALFYSVIAGLQTLLTGVLVLSLMWHARRRTQL